MRSDGDAGAPDFGAFGLAVGHATDHEGGTGCTVVRGIDAPVRAAVATFGRATGSREFPVLDAHHLVDRVDAVLLTGGSAYGLDAAAGVMRWMEEHGRGFDVGVGVVPIVPAAVLFDLAPCGDPRARPTAAMAHAACDAASPSGFDEGSVGAGTGATVGKSAGAARAMKGGVGAATVVAGGVRAGAIAAVNALGDVRDGAGHIIAGARADDGGFLDAARLAADGSGAARFRQAASAAALQNTTLCLVAVDVPMDRVALGQLARAAGAALYRRITPVGTSFDGDVVFATCPIPDPDATRGAGASRGAGSPAGAPVDGMLALQAEALATRALEMAIERAVRLARGRDGVPGLADEARA